LAAHRRSFERFNLIPWFFLVDPSRNWNINCFKHRF
jgi:hypothetical protein